jgi:ubiquinone/menaquinone biosynthesis C-methylase UbiE
MPLAEFVGAHGNIYAVDAQSEMLAILRQKLVGNLLSNVELIHAEAESTSIPASCADLLFLANVWHEMENYDSVLEESRRILNTSGRIAILDWRVDVEPRVGPPLAHRVEAARVVQQLQQAGYSSVNSSEIGSYSWLVTGKRC